MEYICSSCGCVVSENDYYLFNDEIYCDECFHDNTRECDCCGTRILNDEDEGDDNITLCSRCRSDYYCECFRCGRIIHNDDVSYNEDDDPYCHNCYDIENCNKRIHSYSYKPDPIFFGKGKLFMGVELEIDEGGDDSENARLLLDEANEDAEHVYIKHDGSIDAGMEIVTHPMTLEYHMDSMPWQKVTDKAIHLGYRSHKTTTCGLHVHVNRNYFSNDRKVQDDCISRVLYIVERFWQEMLTFSRRTPAQLARWASRYGVKGDPKSYLDDASERRNRYTCVNLCNYNTIEFRIFRGTLKYNTIIATLQMVFHICEAAKYLSDEEITSISWPQFVSDIPEPELIQYLKERRLYVNEPVDDEKEEY